ncbi:MAG: hypothetical protein DRO12_05260 [Thermoprotei archaeon]|nr:MAG: hypothetical protein DRO12_05260 [Thermoprotei archaeon]
MASGKVVSNYDLLLRYVEILERRGRRELIQKTLPNSSDIIYLKDIVVKGTVKTLDEAIAKMKNRFRERIDVDTAVEAYRSLYNTSISEEEAVDQISRILAGYVIEIAEQLGEIKLRNLEVLR